MRNPEQVLNILAEHSNESGYKYERLYRILFNEQMFLVAYQRIHAKPGNMTPGTDGQTEDGMSIDKIHALIDSLKSEVYRPKLENIKSLDPLLYSKLTHQKNIRIK